MSRDQSASHDSIARNPTPVDPLNNKAKPAIAISIQDAGQERTTQKPESG